jgi:hypothetical protein
MITKIVNIVKFSARLTFLIAECNGEEMAGALSDAVVGEIEVEMFKSRYFQLIRMRNGCELSWWNGRGLLDALGSA